MEHEIRYYFPTKQLENIIIKLKNINNLSMENRYYEKTYQYDHPCENMSFYTSNIDGRFRIRISKSDINSSCKISWKRRIPNTLETEVNKEEEVELTIKYSEYENLMFIVNQVLKMKLIESYERYRTIFINDEIEIAVDEYPFGVALEIESKSECEDSEAIVKKWTQLLNLDIGKAYRLSWDDKYKELCKSQNVEQFSHVSFDLPMPQIIDEN